ncbi:MAG: ABC transporter ATP-binding protein [Desulfobulbaceae bacterium]|nr:ABC transporter ATP-binding protein [Desulfobulbaceae bacterium]HIJ78351.1 ATP-binding cassette domain-containing protein [Deltaproteobacteria bacterium]
MIHVEELCKSYDDVEALRGVSFNVQPGEIIGLLGPNGAGKTTIMKILTGYLHQTSGSVTVDGLEVMDHTEEVQAKIGYLPENAPLYPELTVQSYLQMIADLRSIPKARQRARLSAAIHAVGLEERLVRPIATLSKGYRQRVGLAQAILHRPKLLILDEPTNGLDPTQIVEVRHLIKKLAANSTVLLSTHILSEVEATCDRAIIIMRGQVKADARLSTLAATTDALFTLADTGREQEALASLAAMDDVQHVEILGQEAGRINYRVHGATDRDLCPEIYQLARRNDWTLCELRKEVRTLEAVFNELAAAEGGVQ